MADKKTPKIEQKKITDFQPDPINANLGTERGLSMLDDSLSVAGLGRSIVTDKNGIIIAGNKTTERAIDSGFEDAIVVHTTGNTLVVNQRDDLDLAANTPDNPARKLAYYDNRVSQVDLQWSAEQLLTDANAGFDFEHLFYDTELNNLLHATESYDPRSEWEGMPEFEQEEMQAHRRLIVYFDSDEAVSDFAKLIEQEISEKAKWIWHPKQQRSDFLEKAYEDES